MVLRLFDFSMMFFYLCFYFIVFIEYMKLERVYWWGMEKKGFKGKDEVEYR